VPPDVAGRVAITGGLHAQLRRPTRAGWTGPATTAARGSTACTPPIECLSDDIDAGALPRGRQHEHGWSLPLGRAFTTGAAHTLHVGDGEHVMILGPARSGRSTALARVVEAWREATAAGWVGGLAPRRRAAAVASHRSLASLLDGVPEQGPVLIAIDDADLVGDEGTSLADLAAERRPGLLIVAVASADGVRQTYGHWTAVVRRSRLGLITAGAHELDGDLLGATLPRRLPVPARPGLAWVVAGGERTLVQLARDGHGGVGPPCASSAAIWRLPATER
jgi:S-DNA-T family DNA segregation ATPase FtsK/SpoIIIE